MKAFKRFHAAPGITGIAAIARNRPIACNTGNWAIMTSTRNPTMICDYLYYKQHREPMRLDVIQLTPVAQRGTQCP